MLPEKTYFLRFAHRDCSEIEEQEYTRLEDGNIDLQHNTKLEWLDLNYALLTDASKAGFTKLSALKYLNLCNNNFSAFDLRPFVNLERLQMGHNYNLTKIDATRNENLKELAIFDSMYGWNKDYSLQRLIDNFPNLVFLHAFATIATDLDLSKHSKLQSIWLLKSAYGSTSNVVTNGTYNIVCYVDRTLGLDCAGNGTANGTNVQIYPLTPTDRNKQFVLTKQSGDYFQIKDVNSGKVLDVTGGSNKAGTNVELYEWNGTDAQLWKFNKNSDGSYTISSKLKKSTEGDLVLDVDNAKFDLETNVKIWDNTGNIAQRWILLPIEMTVDSRQMAKGPWLHKLDLSGCTELRDIHVQNMHLASLNINSPYIKKPISSEYQNWQFCREVTDHASYLEDKGKLVSGIEVNNNYRHVEANIAKWEKNGKKYWMYYLRLDYDGASSDREARTQIGRKPSHYEIFSYDVYDGNDNGTIAVKGRGSRKKVEIDDPMSDDGFDAGKVKGAYLATEVDNLNTKGVRNHTKGTALCIISEYDGNVTIKNQSAVPAEFLNGINKNVNGTIIILKAGVGETGDVMDLPMSVCYDYECMATAPAGAPGRFGISPMADVNSITGTFYFNVNYPSFFVNNAIVTGVEDVKVEEAAKQIAAVKYYNIAGLESENPFAGVNIMVVTYTDGTKKVTKVLK